MKRYSTVIQEIQNEHQCCSICEQNLCYGILIKSIPEENIDKSNLTYKTENKNVLDKLRNLKSSFNTLAKTLWQEDTILLNNNIGKSEKFNLEINLNKNIITLPEILEPYTSLKLYAYCPRHDTIEKEVLYSYNIRFDLPKSFYESLVETNDEQYDILSSNKIDLNITNFTLESEIYTLTHFDQEDNAGALIKLANQYYLNKTYLSLTSVYLNQDAENNNKFIAKDLIDLPNFFNLKNSKSVYNRIISLMFLE